MNNHPMLNIAVRAARSAGNLILRSVDRIDSLSISNKGRADFVSEVDIQAENEIIRVIKKAYPSHGIQAEETGLKAGDDYTWIIDPLDGTTNFLHGFPQFAVSIAVKHRSELEHAVVYDPMREELYTATRGAGARLNDRRMRVSQTKTLDMALLGTGFPFRYPEHFDAYLKVFRELMGKTSGIRRPGSAALDLAYVAAGRLDGFWEMGLHSWDIAAGALLIKEAGGLICDFSDQQDFLENGQVICGNPRIFKELAPIVQSQMVANKDATS